MYVYVIVILCVLMAVLVRFHVRYLDNSVMVFMSVLLILFAGFRGDVDRDYQIYRAVYYELSAPLSQYASGGAKFLNEPAVNIIGSVSKYVFGSPTVFFLFFAALGVSLKVAAILKMSRNPAMAFFAYFCLYFFLQEMTQIRAGVATGFFLLAIAYIPEKKFWKFLFLILLGSLFHYSLLLALPLYFLNPRRINPAGYVTVLASLILLAFAGGTLPRALSAISGIPLASRVTAYLGQENSPDLANPFLWIRVAFALFLVFSSKAYKGDRLAVVLVKCYFVSLFAYFGCYPIAGFSIRLRELLGAVEILLVPLAISISRDRLSSTVLADALMISSLGAYLFMIGLLEPYGLSV